PPPKSLDRNAFAQGPVASLSAEDGAATLTAFTAASIARAREHFPEQPKMWIIAGGGRRNRTLMAMIAERVEAIVAPAEAAGRGKPGLILLCGRSRACRSAFPAPPVLPNPSAEVSFARLRAGPPEWR